MKILNSLYPLAASLSVSKASFAEIQSLLKGITDMEIVTMFRCVALSVISVRLDLYDRAA